MRVRVNAVALANLLIGLQDACHTCHQLADLTGLRVGTVRHYLSTLHAKGIIHICDWSEDAKGGRTLKVFTLGSGADMSKPKPKGAKAACVKYRAKKKQLKLLTAMFTPPTTPPTTPISTLTKKVNHAQTCTAN